MSDYYRSSEVHWDDRCLGTNWFRCRARPVVVVRHWGNALWRLPLCKRHQQVVLGEDAGVHDRVHNARAHDQGQRGTHPV